MCRCETPTVNGQPGKYQSHSYPPTLQDGDKLLIDAPGRCGTPPGCKSGIDSHAYHHRLISSYSRHYILTRHGGGEERYRLDYGTSGGIPTILDADPEAQYWLLGLLYNTARMAAESARAVEAARWASAAANKRIKTRKERGYPSVKVRIAPAIDDKLCFSL